MGGDSIEHIDKLSDRDILEALMFHPDFDNDRRKFLSLIEANNGFQNILEKYLVDLCDELRDKEYYLKEDHDELLSRVPSIGKSYVKVYTDKPFLNIVKPVLNKNLSISYFVRRIFAVPSDTEMKSNFLEDLTENVTPRLIDIIRKKYVDELCLQQILDFSREILITGDSHNSSSRNDVKLSSFLTDGEYLSDLSDSDDGRHYSDTCTTLSSNISNSNISSTDYISVTSGVVRYLDRPSETTKDQINRLLADISSSFSKMDSSKIGEVFGVFEDATGYVKVVPESFYEDITAFFELGAKDLDVNAFQYASISDYLSENRTDELYKILVSAKNKARAALEKTTLLNEIKELFTGYVSPSSSNESIDHTSSLEEIHIAKGMEVKSPYKSQVSLSQDEGSTDNSSSAGYNTMIGDRSLSLGQKTSLSSPLQKLPASFSSKQEVSEKHLKQNLYVYPKTQDKGGRKIKFFVFCVMLLVTCLFAALFITGIIDLGSAVLGLLGAITLVLFIALDKRDSASGAIILDKHNNQADFTKSYDIYDKNNSGGLGLDDLNAEKSSIISKSSFDSDTDTYITAIEPNSDDDNSFTSYT